MFNDADETLKQYLTAAIPIANGEVDISFERPSREWSGRLSRPTLNCFLYDIRERSGFRDDTATRIADGKGGFRAQRPPRRIDLSYMVTAWAREAEDEHRILARTLAAMYRAGEIDRRFFQGHLLESEYPVLARIVPPDHVAKPADLWGVLDNELRTSLVWVMAEFAQLGIATRGFGWPDVGYTVLGGVVAEAVATILANVWEIGRTLCTNGQAKYC